MPWMHEDMVYAWKTGNARVWPEPVRTIPWEGFHEERYFVRFGSAQANAILLLEIGSVRKLDSFDIEWYEGLFLRRLRPRLFAQPEYTDGYRQSFDHVANTYQYDWVDLDAAIAIGKRRYYAILLRLLREMITEEGASGAIAKVAVKAFKFSEREWEQA